MAGHLRFPELSAGTPSATASSSRMNNYELSDDLQRRRVEVLERRYGGRERAHAAATRIQRAFREWNLDRRFRLMMSSSHEGLSARQSQLYSMHSFAALSSIPARPFVSPLQRIVPPVEADFTPRKKGEPSPNRYTPATSLLAQLRADRGLVAPSSLLDDHSRRRSGTRSPPSPAPSRSQRGGGPVIESLMSPRLVARRIVGPPVSTHLSPDHVPGPPMVWVPRTAVAYPEKEPVPLHPTHSNSLPRIEKRERRERAASQALPPRAVSDAERKRQYRVALNFFNKNPARGVQLLTQWGFVDESPESLAKLMFGRRGLSKQMVGELLGQHGSPFHARVLDCFISQIDVRGMEVDAALRKVLSYFRLPGEAQKIERIMQAFSTHYARLNPSRAACFAGGADTIFVLAFAVIMLNTDLHSRSIRPAQRMSKADFIKNLKGVDAGGDMDREMLGGIYERIRAEEFVHGDDHVAQVARVEADVVGKEKPRLAECHRRLVCYCRLHAIADPSRRQGEGAHERDVFLFNDMILVTKSVAKKKTRSGVQYMLKAHSPLLGARVQLFSSPLFAFGIEIDCRPVGPLLLFSAKNCEDRMRFVHDVQEAVLECAQMERARLEMEYGKQQRERPLRADSLRDSGLPEGAEAETEVSGDCSSGTSSSSLAPPSAPRPRAAFSRRLSFNSLDSGMVEEHFDAAAV